MAEVLVTGGSGFIGSYCTLALLDAGFSVRTTVRDLARELALPLVIAASPGLGTINHTLMTVEAARAVGLEVAAVVVTPWPAEPPTVEASNRDAIERLGDVRVETLVTIDLVDPERWPALDLP